MRRLRVLVAVLLASGTATSAQPYERACTTVFSELELSEGIYFPSFPVAADVAILPFDIAGCAGDGTLSMANCGLATGDITVNGRTASLVIAGETLAVGVPGSRPHGVLHIHPAAGQDCSSGVGASRFVVSGYILV